MQQLNKICVFCGSREGNDIEITEQARHVGKFLAMRNITLVYGAAKIGIMGIVAKNVLENKGHVIGVIPDFLKMKEVVHLGLTELITTETMHERKLRMHKESDAFIALPGGMGTFEELFEIITWQQLGLHQKPIGILNSNGFYDDLIAMLETMVRKGFLSMNHYNLIQVDSNIENLLEKLESFKKPRLPQWLTKDKA